MAATSSASASDPRTRKIRIKTGVVRRLAREEACYVEEARQQEARIERMQSDLDVDECDVRKQREVLQECHMMIPDCRLRLAAAHRDLREALEGAEEEAHRDLAQCQEFRDARSVLEAVKMEEEEEEEEEEEGGSLVTDSVMMGEETIRASGDCREL